MSWSFSNKRPPSEQDLPAFRASRLSNAHRGGLLLWMSSWHVEYRPSRTAAGRLNRQPAPAERPENQPRPRPAASPKPGQPGPGRPPGSKPAPGRPPRRGQDPSQKKHTTKTNTTTPDQAG